MLIRRPRSRPAPDVGCELMHATIVEEEASEVSAGGEGGRTGGIGQCVGVAARRVRCAAAA